MRHHSWSYRGTRLTWLRGKLVKVWNSSYWVSGKSRFISVDKVWRMHVTTGTVGGVRKNSEAVQGSEARVCGFWNHQMLIENLGVEKVKLPLVARKVQSHFPAWLGRQLFLTWPEHCSCVHWLPSSTTLKPSVFQLCRLCRGHSQMLSTPS